ncbi:hypothetical protein AcW1_002028 [Taiwanofungus camphoratus]|nr:hypothetical protein AcW1_002028 [Antrodia cinnamomea]
MPQMIDECGAQSTRLSLGGVVDREHAKAPLQPARAPARRTPHVPLSAHSAASRQTRGHGRDAGPVGGQVPASRSQESMPLCSVRRAACDMTRCARVVWQGEGSAHAEAGGMYPEREYA